jgi:hypothetical protein
MLGNNEPWHAYRDDVHGSLAAGAPRRQIQPAWEGRNMLLEGFHDGS